MIKCAEQSPRICNDGTIRWYEGDTFSLEFDLIFTDDNGEEVPTQETDEITICFRDKLERIIYETSVVGTTILNVIIDEETTKKFKRGTYKYCVRRKSDYITTIMRMNEVVIE